MVPWAVLHNRSHVDMASSVALLLPSDADRQSLIEQQTSVNHSPFRIAKLQLMSESYPNGHRRVERSRLMPAKGTRKTKPPRIQWIEVSSPPN